MRTTIRSYTVTKDDLQLAKDIDEAECQVIQAAINLYHYGRGVEVELLNSAIKNLLKVRSA